MRNVLFVRLNELYFRADQALILGNWYELHLMRISAKRLRYSMELYQICFDSDFRKKIDTLKAIQDQLGKIQDCGMMIEYFGKNLRQKDMENKDQETPDRHSVNEFLSDEITRLGKLRDELYSNFLVFWNDLNQKQFLEKLLALIDKTFRMKVDLTKDLNLMERVFIDEL